MELKTFIDEAFEKYEETFELADFKEELLSNLQDRLSSLESSGVKRVDALKQIETELVDINKIADEMSLEKKKEVFEMRYMSLKNFITKPRAAIYTILGMIIVSEVIIALATYLNSGKVETLTRIMLVTLAFPCSGLTYLGLTQETPARNPMHPMRALSYAIAIFILLFGALFVATLIFWETQTLVGALKILIPIVLPSIGLIVFLMITESEHRKLWVLKEVEKQNEWTKNFEASGKAQTFGIISGGIWVLAIGAFILLLLIKLWFFSWLPLVAATGVEMMLLAHYMKK